MTETMIDLPGVIAKSDDADVLRELIQDAAQCQTAPDRDPVSAPKSGPLRNEFARSPDRENQRNGYRPC